MIKKCIIEKYDPACTEAPFLSIKLGECTVDEPEEDYLGQKLAALLREECCKQGYTFRFYTLSSKNGYDYEITIVS